MASSNRFGGTYCLNKEEIDKHVSSEGGNYRLIKSDSKGNLIVCYVGRAVDLKKRLKEHINDSHSYKSFSVRYEPDEVQRYYIECREYHYWSERVKLYNERHPDKPNGYGGRMRYVCPVCGQ